MDQSEWATFEKVLGGLGLSATPSEAVSPGLSTPKGGRETPSGRPTLPAIDALRELESRPQTPTVVGLEKDERDDFLRRENELADALAEKVGCPVHELHARCRTQSASNNPAVTCRKRLLLRRRSRSRS